ncbi:enoyl-CoA hydratase-related protein [Sinomonas atrocyanea]
MAPTSSDPGSTDLGSYATLELDLTDGILTLTVNRPQALNALSQQVISDLWKAFTAIEDSCTHDAGWPVRGVILTGAGARPSWRARTSGRWRRWSPTTRRSTRAPPRA